MHFRQVSVGVDEGEASTWLAVNKGIERDQKVVVNGAILLSQN